MKAIDTISHSAVDAILNSLQNSPFRWYADKDGDIFSSSESQIKIGNWNEPASLIIIIGDTVYSTPKGTVPDHVSEKISLTIRSYLSNRQQKRTQALVDKLT